jgi:hypothetical protein
LLSPDPPNDVLKAVNIFYHDTITVKGKDTYRELTRVGENPFAKPTSVDIRLTLATIPKSTNNDIEILIEELYEPTELGTSGDGLAKRTWVPHQVVFHGNTNFIKDGRIEIKDIKYKTAYFIGSILYLKKGFRVVALFYDRETTKLERVEKDIMYDM